MPPITTDTATLRKERGDEDTLGSLSHPTRSPVLPHPPGWRTASNQIAQLHRPGRLATSSKKRIVDVFGE